MTAPEAYVTLEAPARAEIEVKRSRFVADLQRVGTEEQARARIEQVRAGSRPARHHCTAFVLGPDAAIQRSNDDGEPSGTAGAPMLDVLRGAGLTDVVAVVTRWFGGVLLGTGGLIRAYGDAVHAALDTARLVRVERRVRVAVDVAASTAPRLEHALRAAGTAIEDSQWGADTVRLTVAVTATDLETVEAIVAAVTEGRARPEPAGEVWVDRPIR